MDMNIVIRIVEGHAERLAERWLLRLRKEEAMMEVYLRVPEDNLLSHVRKAYEEIGTYLGQPRHPVIAAHFRETGKRRKREGVPLTAVVRAIQLARSVMWQYVLEQGIFDSTVNLYQAMNLYREVVACFDQAILFAVEGYGEEDHAA